MAVPPAGNFFVDAEGMGIMGKYVAGWVLGFPLIATVLLYILYS